MTQYLGNVWFWISVVIVSVGVHFLMRMFSGGGNG